MLCIHTSSLVSLNDQERIHIRPRTNNIGQSPVVRYSLNTSPLIVEVIQDGRRLEGVQDCGREGG